MDRSALIQTLDRVFANRYRIDALIGVGTVSAVFAAFDLVEGRAVAVKVFDQAFRNDDQFREQLFAAAEHAATFDHPNIVSVYDWGVEDGPFVVSELCEGGSLASLLAAGNRLTASQALVMALESARALHFGHQRGIAHRNLKPTNVLFAADQRVRVSDYGFAQVLADAPISVESRGVEAVRYVSPEQARGRPVAEPTDLYSLVLVVNEAVTGEPPHATDTVVGTLMARAESAAVVSDELSGLQTAMDRCGYVEPGRRPGAEELSISLLAAAETMPRPSAFPLVRIVATANALVQQSVVDFDDPSMRAEGPPSDQGPGPSTVADLTAVMSSAVPSGAHDLADSEASLAVDGAMAEVGFDVASDLARVGLEDLPTTEPAFAAAVASERAFDIPTRAVAKRVEVGHMVEADDADDRLPWWPLLLLGLMVAGAVAAIVYFTTFAGSQESATVPDLVGVAYEDLGAALSGRGWEIERLEGRENGTEPGTIVRQAPLPGEALDEGEVLTVTVSLGNEMIEIPADVVGLTVEQAETRLGSVGLGVGALTQEHNESLEAGLVIALDEPTTQKPAGEPVALRVSLGPLARVVPDSVLGMTIADATALLTGLRLLAVEELVYHPDAPPGTVLGSDPAPGVELPADSQVTLLVSDGPEPVEIPDVVGLPLAEAIDAIEELGLIFLDSEGTPGDDVTGTIPEIGETVDVGTEVVIVLGDPDAEEDDEGN